MNRFLASKRPLVLVPWLACACGSTGLVLSAQNDAGVDGRSPDSTPDSAIADAGSAGDSSDANTCTPQTPDAWGVSAVGLRSQGCKTALDCVAVYIGDDACEADIVHGLHCPNYAISKDSYAEYQSRYQAANAACRPFCGVGALDCKTTPIYCDMEGVSGPNCELCPPNDAGGCPDGGATN